MRSDRAITARVARPTVLSTMVLILGACDVSPRTVTVSMRDSAGIAIVENRWQEGANLAVWRLADTADVLLGADEGEPSHEFNVVVGAVRLSDGRIVIGDRGSREIRYFDANGRHLLTVGGSGEGPGEFSRLAAIDLLPGDTLVASDWPIGTLSWFDPLGTYLARTRIGPYWPGLTGRVLADGSLLVDTYARSSYGNEIEWWAAYGQEETFRPTGLLVRVSRDGTEKDTLGPIAGEEFFKVGRPREGLAVRVVPFSTTTAVAWRRDRFYIGETGTAEVRVLRYDGTVERLIRWDRSAVAVTPADRDGFADTVLSRLRQQRRRPDYQRWLAAVSFPDSTPTFRTLAVDPSGNLWVRRWSNVNSTRDQWLVFTADGRLIAKVEMPLGLTILHLGDHAVLALWRDELDLEYVGSFRIVRAGPGADR
jgi:hypothetical protein